MYGAKAGVMVPEVSQPKSNDLPQRVVIVSACGAGMLATFLPWVSLGIASVSGTAGDGWATLILLLTPVLLAVATWRRPLDRAARVTVVVTASAAGLVGLYDASGLRDSAMIGGGLYLVILASIVAVVAACVGRSKVPPVVAAVIAAATITVGFLHFTVGDGVTSLQVCPKNGWSLRESFISVDDYVGSFTGKSRVELDAAEDLDTCGIIKIARDSPAPEPATRSRAPKYGYCRLDDHVGVCIPESECGYGPVTGLCPGPAEIVCCFK